MQVNKSMKKRMELVWVKKAIEDLESLEDRD